ncbi:MAG: Rossmann-like and DUF2520 domain-containing protein [Limnochordia bacterium]
MGTSVSFIGAGRVGSSLARALSARGYEVDVLVRRTLAGAKETVLRVGAGRGSTDVGEAAAADIVFLTVPDGAIEQVCNDVAVRGLWEPRHTVVHCSGALSLRVLRAAADRGAAVLSLHPMQSVADTVSGAESLLGSFFGLEGCRRGLIVGEELVQALDGRALHIAPGGKAAYHAAAVMVSNYLVALMDVGCDLFVKAGLPREDAVAALLPLAKGTLANVEEQGIPRALTGPIERGDATTVVSHLRILDENPELKEIYCLLGQRTVHLAKRKGSAGEKELAAIAALL